MPTVLRFGRFHVVIYLNDHRPGPVHVIGSDSEAIFNLNCPDGPVTLRENFGFPRSEIRRIKPFLAVNREVLYGAWKEIHGEF